MELVNDPDYIPTTLRKSQQTTIAAIQEDVKRVQREIDRDRNLVETINAITSSVSAGDTQMAYDARESLLSNYPGTRHDELLHEAVLTISEKERENVRVVDEPLQPWRTTWRGCQDESVILSHRMGQAVGGVSDHVVYVLAGGVRVCAGCRDR